MDSERKTPSWWSTLPGVLTAIAAIITAVGGLLLALHQVRPPAGASSAPHAQERPADRAGADVAWPTSGRNPASGTPVANVPAAQYPIMLASGAEARAGHLVYRILGARLEHYSDGPDGRPNKVVLRLAVRITDVMNIRGYVNREYFTLIADGVRLEPQNVFGENVWAQSATEVPDIVFVIPVSAGDSVLLEVGKQGEATARIPISLTSGAS
jgi:hypothetical protein